ncbi:MAG: CooT family nickel-binding protein [Candidatus Bathyarchaeia archaeon]|nr:CooT family nickel-binding protein [Candidatus Bathyarchaeota archaeon]
MCLLKVYIEDARTGEKTFVSGNAALISADGEALRIIDVEGAEKIISGVDFLMIDALKSTIVLRVKGLSKTES